MGHQTQHTRTSIIQNLQFLKFCFLSYVFNIWNLTKVGPEVYRFCCDGELHKWTRYHYYIYISLYFQREVQKEIALIEVYLYRVPKVFKHIWRQATDKWISPLFTFTWSLLLYSLFVTSVVHSELHKNKICIM
jgi:hypothetical protein